MWIQAGRGNPDWDATFDRFRSATDYPSCSHWRALAKYYPQAKFILTERGADSWFNSVSETIFSPETRASLKDTPAWELNQLNVLNAFGDRIDDRAFMTDRYEKRNQEVIDTLPPERLLLFHPKQGWEPLCAFLGVPVPEGPFPRVNSRDEMNAASGERGGFPPEPEAMERFARAYIDQLKASAFAD